MTQPQILDATNEARFDSWYAALRSAVVAGRHAPVVTPAATMRSMLLEQERGRRVAYGIFDGSNCHGAALVEWDTEQNSHLGEVEVCVPPAARRRGFGTALLERVRLGAAEAGLTTLVAEVDAATAEWPGLRFAEQHRFEVVHTEDRLVLDLPLGDHQLEQLAAQSPAPGQGYSCRSWSGSTPDDLRETLAALQTRMNAEVPTGERDADPVQVTPESLAASDRRLATRGYHSIRTVAVAADGEPAGYSHLFALDHDPVHAIQDDTYVLARHRGHRLGTMLKAANLRALQRDRPAVRHVHTWTAEHNDPMQVINADFGFRAVETMYEVQHRRA